MPFPSLRVKWKKWNKTKTVTIFFFFYIHLAFFFYSIFCVHWWSSWQADALEVTQLFLSLEAVKVGVCEGVKQKKDEKEKMKKKKKLLGKACTLLATYSSGGGATYGLSRFNTSQLYPMFTFSPAEWPVVRVLLKGKSVSPPLHMIAQEPLQSHSFWPR